MDTAEQLQNTSACHAYIVAGQSSPTTLTLARAAVCTAETGAARPCLRCPACLKALRGVHPDIIEVTRGEGSGITVDIIRGVRDDALLVPNDGARKVYIIRDADTMNPSAQNALLKLLEEPPSGVVIILEALNPRALLPTIRSRCVTVAARETRDAAYAGGADELLNASIAGGLDLVKFSFNTMDKLDADGLMELLTSAYLMAEERLRSGASDARVRRRLLEVAGVLERAMEFAERNVPAGHVSGLVCAELVDPPEDGI